MNASLKATLIANANTHAYGIKKEFVKNSIELLYYVRSNDNYLVQTNYREKFNNMTYFSTAIKSLYQSCGVDNIIFLVIEFMMGDVAPLYLLYDTALTEEQITLIESTLGVSLETVNSNIVRLIPN